MTARLRLVTPADLDAGRCDAAALASRRHPPVRGTADAVTCAERAAQMLREAAGDVSDADRAALCDEARRQLLAAWMGTP